MERKTYYRHRTYGGSMRRKEHPDNCIEAVYPRDTSFGGMIDQQCSRKRGHGPDGLFCRQHAKRYAPDAVDERKHTES